MDIAIIDYGVGNLRSAEKAFQHLGFDAALTTDPAALASARKLVLPGVGAFGECMERLREHGFVEPLLKEVSAGKPLLGICVGLQMLFEKSEESPGVPGLGLLKGTVKKFSGPQYGLNGGLKIPQIGWNNLTYPPQTPRHPLFAELAPGTHVYFVHSFFAQPDDPAEVLAFSDYGGPFCASAGRGNVMGVQFHPRKKPARGTVDPLEFCEDVSGCIGPMKDAQESPMKKALEGPFAAVVCAAGSSSRMGGERAQAVLVAARQNRSLPGRWPLWRGCRS